MDFFAVVWTNLLVGKFGCSEHFFGQKLFLGCKKDCVGEKMWLKKNLFRIFLVRTKIIPKPFVGWDFFVSDIMFGGIFWVGQKCLVRKIFSRNFFGRNFFLVNIFLVETFYHQFFFIFHLVGSK